MTKRNRFRMPETVEQAAGVLGLLELEDVLAPISDDRKQRLQRALEDYLERDYIPENAIDGGRCPMREDRNDLINVRKAIPGMRCANQTADDSQSGPIYCGQPASIMADSLKYPGMFYAMCRRHQRQHGISESVS